MTKKTFSDVTERSSDSVAEVRRQVVLAAAADRRDSGLAEFLDDALADLVASDAVKEQGRA